MDAIDITFTMRYYEEHTEGKRQEVAHAIAYAYGTGRISSKMEKELVNWIKSLNIIVEENNRTLIHKELDIYIPSHNLAIEFDGLYWHSELQGKNSKYHLSKNKI